ncbi:hypothetical protein BDV27DRAFT_151850 [Aspergillus caelatus]|uniref:Uncharacterized protein n=1 Tax=Aspergillus caelatus TaxID=61420 RepID=A0A5N7APD4_9EURO|nr:uncharacterized protein BDV27DRAFT_151850 [Aspergillus caelatus]KAE8370590.1 hypothetical protein BDV27DRAFT_151850 [Aspergillus caelatus]
MRTSLSATICLSLLLPAVPTIGNPLNAENSNGESIRHDSVQLQPFKPINTAHPLAVRSPDGIGCSDDNKRCGLMCIDKDEECNSHNSGWDWWRRSLEDSSGALAARSPDWGCAEDNKRCGLMCIPKNEDCNPNYGCSADNKRCGWMCIDKNEECNSETGGWDWWRRSLEEPSHALAVRSPDWGCAEDNKRCGLMCIPKNEDCNPNYGCSADNKRCGWMCIDKNEECNSETGGWDWWRRSLEEPSQALAVRSPDWGCADDNKRCGLMCIPKNEDCNPNYGCSNDNKRCGLMCIDKDQECNSETGGWDWWRRSLENHSPAIAARSPDGFGCADDNKRCGWMCIPKDEQCCGNQGSCSANEECHKNDNGDYGCCAKGETCTNTNGTWLNGVRQVGNDIKDGVKSVVDGGAADLRPEMVAVGTLTSLFAVAMML